METLRSFIALELTPQIQKQLAQIQDRLKESDADLKWVKPEGIHLTLKFLGNVSLALLEQIKQAISQLAKEHKCFELKLGQLGAFPTKEHPRVIWVGIDKGTKQATELALDLEERLIKFGFFKEKHPFRAHLTLGRVRSARNREPLKQLLTSVTVAAYQTSMPAETIVLFKSTLTRQGAIYQALHKAKLS